MKNQVTNPADTKSRIPAMIFMAAAGLVVGLLLPKLFQDDKAIAESGVISPSADAPTPNTKKEEPLLTQAPELANIQEQLQNQLQKETLARQQLETKLNEISARVSSLEKSQLSTSTNDSPQESTTTISTHAQQGVNRPGWINTQALIDAGVDEYQANKIRDTYENVEMQKLYLRDRAVREGWIGDEKYRNQVNQLDSQVTALRDQLNEKEYDAFLYATGRPNRVVIESTLSTSPARDAGIKPGDNIVRYNSTPIYTWTDLRDATTQCQTDATVEVELDRNGQHQRVYVPCGPLGVRLDNTSVPP
jgi:hypothetical protein